MPGAFYHAIHAMELGRIRAAITRRGKPLSEETRKKISDARKKRIENIPKQIKTKPVRIKPTKEELDARASARSAYKRFLRRVLKLSGKRKDAASMLILGYGPTELKAEIESKFIGEMSWENRSSFHIDHIVPVDAFSKRGIFDPKIVNSLVNLRPMSPIENQKKSNKYNMENFDSDLLAIIEFNNKRESIA